MSRHALLPRLALLALLLPAGCDLLSAEVELKTVCATLPNYAMQATPVSGTFVTDLTYDLGSDLDFLNDPDVASTLRLTSLELVVQQGDVDLTGVERLSATVVPPASSTLPEVVAAVYTRGDAPSTTSMTAVAPEPVDLYAYLTEGQASLHLEATGTMPAVDWTATITACFVAEMQYDYGNQL